MQGCTKMRGEGFFPITCVCVCMCAHVCVDMCWCFSGCGKKNHVWVNVCVYICARTLQAWNSAVLLVRQWEFKQITEEKSDHYATPTLCFTLWKQVGAGANRMKKFHVLPSHNNGWTVRGCRNGTGPRKWKVTAGYSVWEFQWCRQAAEAPEKWQDYWLLTPSGHKRNGNTIHNDSQSPQFGDKTTRVSMHLTALCGCFSPEASNLTLEHHWLLRNSMLACATQRCYRSKLNRVRDRTDQILEILIWRFFIHYCWNNIS